MSLWSRIKERLAGKDPPKEGDGEGEESGESSQREVGRAARRDLDRKIATLSRAIAQLPDGGKKIGAYFERGVAYKDLDDLDSALADFARVAEVIPVLADVHAHRGECLLRRGDHALAIDSLDRAIALLDGGVGLAVVYLNRGNARAATGELEAALADYARAAEIAPETAEAAREEQARVRTMQGTGKTAVAGKPRDEASAESFLARGREHDARGDLVDALVAFSKAIEIDPGAMAYYNRGLANCKLRRYPQAIADLDRALEKRPRFAAALTERGLARVESGQLDEGLEDYDAALAVDPSYPMAYVNKGSAYLLKKRWAEAVPYLDIALRLDPKRAIARYNRGVAHEMLGDLARALRDYRDTLRSAITASSKGRGARSGWTPSRPCECWGSRHRRDRRRRGAEADHEVPRCFGADRAAHPTTQSTCAASALACGSV